MEHLPALMTAAVALLTAIGAGVVFGGTATGGQYA